MDRICIYHKNCVDGFGAAFAVWKKYGEDCIYHASTYNDPVPDITNKKVILVDFSYKKDIILEICQKAKSVLILDHHKTTIEELQDYIKIGNKPVSSDLPTNLTGILDTERSGAVIAWEFFHPDVPLLPNLLYHIQDRDLWKFESNWTKAIIAALMSYPYDFKTWDNLMFKVDDDMLYQEGRAILRKHEKDVQEILGMAVRKLKIADIVVPAVNASYLFASDIGHILAKEQPFAAIYYDTPEGCCFSLRSETNGHDVSHIAKQYGGGGHKHAAGFTVSFNKAAEFEI